VKLYAQCGSDNYCHHAKFAYLTTQNLHSATQNLRSMVLLWKYGAALEVWCCSGSMVLLWKYDAALEVWCCSGSMMLLCG